MFYSILVACAWFSSCKQKTNEEQKETRTSGEAIILVDETYANILDDQIEVFKADYPSATINVVTGNENEILPQFRKGENRVIVLSRMLKPADEAFYKNGKIPIYTTRFAIDGIALIVAKQSSDTLITVNEVYDIMRGTSKSNKQLVFDNAYSSTIRYFIDSAGVNKLPDKGVYTLETTNDVIKFVAENNNYIGVLGVNWLVGEAKDSSPYLKDIKTLAVKNLPGKKHAEAYYQPTQQNLIDGKYPFLRNVYIINGEGKNGLGTGFANWLASPRGQLIVLKSGLGPHEIAEREFNWKNK